MLHSLFGKLALTLFLLMLVVGTALLGVATMSGQMLQQEVTQRLHAGLAAQMVQSHVLLDDGKPDDSTLTRLFDELMVINPSIEVYLLAADGHLLTHAAPPGHIRRERVDLAPIRRFIEGERRYPLLGDDPRQVDGRKPFSVAPIAAGASTAGYLYIILAGETHTGLAEALLQSHALHVGGLGLAASLVAALSAGLALFRWLTRRLSILDARVQALAPDTDAPSLHGDELARLEQRFDQMARHIHQQVEQLQTMDTQRREMVANVSHDLRTPLASLQGYLETLLMKADSLTPAQRVQYLQTALRNSRDLGQLLDQLFELARLDAGDTRPVSECFALDELVQDTLIRHRLHAQQHGIDLTLDCDDLTSAVTADIRLIQRVLDNLIDNAMQHTPRGGQVRVHLKTGPKGVEVAIADTGCGIPADELPRVFDRFYRRDKSRKASPTHAGLGLAIASHIVELHGATLRADSQPGQGTTFRFDLPTANSL